MFVASAQPNNVCIAARGLILYKRSKSRDAPFPGRDGGFDRIGRLTIHVDLRTEVYRPTLGKRGVGRGWQKLWASRQEPNHTDVTFRSMTHNLSK